jgi:hypothetical protein
MAIRKCGAKILFARKPSPFGYRTSARLSNASMANVSALRVLWILRGEKTT